ncbi:DNA repair protein RAD50 [Erysiphe necator]|nr:DNA repair protein RAD50 [Erysiphe necator]
MFIPTIYLMNISKAISAISSSNELALCPTGALNFELIIKTEDISRLKIQGIRSFDNQHPEYINFYAPLTLIVGQNGCGKTSIIECLKYASTGQQPPNTKGGAFIHDPKLSGEKETLGHVKLEFLNASQNKLVVSRTISLTTKKTGVTQKTLDCTLLMHNHGERHTMSTRVADMDRIVPAQMGVTAAVLDNVIFCHQDDSLWPMAEPQKLKEKFDKIFDAQKYTKAIENMIKMRKLHKDELGKLVIHEANNKAMKEKADKVQRRLLSLEAEIDSIRGEIETYNLNIKLASEETKKKKIASIKALGTIEELRTKRDRAEGYKSFLATLKADLEELQDSDEWLQSTLDKYEERMAQYHLQSLENQSKIQELQRAQTASRQACAEKQTEIGLHQAEQKSYEIQVETRSQLIREIAQKYTIKGFEGDLNEDQISRFMEKFQKLIQEKDRELDQAKKLTNEKLHKIRDELTALENRKAIRIQEKLNSKDAINTNDSRIIERQREADAIDVDEGTKAALEASLIDTQQRLSESHARFEAMSWDKNLKAEDVNLKHLELEASHLKNELFEINRLSKEQAALEYAKTQAKNAKRSLEAMIDACNEKLTTVLNQDWTPEKLEKRFQDVLDEKSKALVDATRKRDLAERELLDHEFKLSTICANLKSKTDEIKRCEKVVLSSITTATGQPLQNIENFLEELCAIETERDELRQDLGSMSVVREYYEKSLTTIRDQNCCRLCERKFANALEKVSAESKIENLLKKYVEERARQDLEDLEKDLRRANAVRPQYETFNKLFLEIPSIQKEVKDMEIKKLELLAARENWDSISNDKMTEKQDIEILSSNVNDIVKYYKENLKYMEEINKLSSQKKSSSNCLSVQEIQEKSSRCDEKLHAVRKKIEKLMIDKNNANSEISSLEIEVGNIKQKLNSTEFLLEKKNSLLKAIDELREDSKSQRDSMRKADMQLESLIPQFSKVKAMHDDVQRRGEIQAKEIQKDKDKLSQSLNKLVMVVKDINKYVENGGPEKLVVCRREIYDLEKAQKSIENEIAQVTQDEKSLNSHINDSEKIKRSIMSNIRYRKALKDLEITNQEILELEERIRYEDADRLVQEHLAAETRGQDLMAERGPLVGKMGAKDSELTALIKEWETDYKDAGQKYKEMHIKVETTKAAIEDVIKCIHAVDSAVMKYHTLKMEEINAIAGDLWTSTYQGTDIDTIMIRSENETSSTTTTKRNYNYRLCMVKQDAELDMRGRCSAGQRVLASIIIRLALAECFGVSCGVIALDEPTTNLDRENINALAESLNRIIHSRRRQSNFQLIIITHDEEFLQAMKCNEFTDIFWHVSRDAHQKSTIKMESLKENN